MYMRANLRNRPNFVDKFNTKVENFNNRVENVIGGVRNKVSSLVPEELPELPDLANTLSAVSKYSLDAFGGDYNYQTQLDYFDYPGY